MDPSKYSKSITPLSKVVLNLPPSCIEFVPWRKDEPSNGEWLVVGTYELQKEKFDEKKSAGPQSRSGSLVLFQLKNCEAVIVDSILTRSAVLDLHFIPGTHIFAATDSTGGLKLLNLQRNAENDSYSLKEIHHHQIFPLEDEVLILSFTWYPHGDLSPPSLALTLSTGAIHVIRFTSWAFESYLGEHGPIHTHSQKAESCAWSPYTKDLSLPTCIFTGGDDVREPSLRISQLPHMKPGVEFDLDEDIQSPPSSKLRPHESGLTAILPLPGSAFSDSKPVLLTGGYDGYVRVYAPLGDASTHKAKVLAELEIGGGVWKLKFITYDINLDKGGSEYRILASCMHAGARILDVIYDGSDWTFQILGDVSHDLNYASDFQPFDPEPSIQNQSPNSFTASQICISTSFYDRLLCVWRFDPALESL